MTSQSHWHLTFPFFISLSLYLCPSSLLCSFIHVVFANAVIKILNFCNKTSYWYFHLLRGKEKKNHFLMPSCEFIFNNRTDSAHQNSTLIELTATWRDFKSFGVGLHRICKNDWFFPLIHHPQPSIRQKVMMITCLFISPLTMILSLFQEWLASLLFLMIGHFISNKNKHNRWVWSERQM